MRTFSYAMWVHSPWYTMELTLGLIILIVLMYGLKAPTLRLAVLLAGAVGAAGTISRAPSTMLDTGY